MSDTAVSSFTSVSITRDIPEHKLAFKGWTPFGLSTPLRYWIAYIHQTIGGYYGGAYFQQFFFFSFILIANFIVLANLNIAFDTFFPALMMATCAQLRILKHRFQYMHEIIAKYEKSNDKKIYYNRQQMEKNLLIDCTTHHLAIYELSF